MKSEKLLHTQNEDLSVYAGVFLKFTAVYQPSILITSVPRYTA